jgi:2-dehydro-3-deoxyphosphogluconate aldolase/(4S)-4-hydroxy-2-oxoglutarate aldolase
LTRIHDIGIVPVVVLEDAGRAVPLAGALVEGGLPVAEITFRTEAAGDAIRAIVKEVPEMIVGAGTVLTKEQADRAIEAGASFIVSPGFNPETTAYVMDRGVCMIPGTATPGEMEQAMMMGLDTVKFFPAEQNGGIDMLKALAGPYRGLKWLPTGGINSENLSDYLSFPQVLACGGTWMVKKDLVEGGKWSEITYICKKAVKKMLNLELDHVGINCGDEAEAVRTATTLCALFDLKFEQARDFASAGEGFELMKGKGRGRCGHIGLTTPDVDRAVYHLKRAGALFDGSSVIRDDKGTRLIYLDGEFAGFAIHLIRKGIVERGR